MVSVIRRFVLLSPPTQRKDNEHFYATHLCYSFKDFVMQLKIYNRRDYNNFPMHFVRSENTK